ncbi:hypothetical protein E2562_014071 [Oryza meyeriana var. granulata]|uniref:Uncharacterized protein n=1 Tax=Oryza meyeriana var. granulata TaxID=110450 RepID=A0A6G1DJP5_9ORYZ|nr:hypothetical protein E2562_014071 [Oryza meyeriana var. granulata]
MPMPPIRKSTTLLKSAPNALHSIERLASLGVMCDLGLEKYAMTKLFDRTFASSAEDVKTDMEISEKIGLLQRFVRPHHLDIPKVLHNETAWLPKVC